MKTIRFMMGIAVILIVCYLSFDCIKNDIRKTNKRKTVDSCINQKELIIERLTVITDSSSYYLDRIIDCFGTDNFSIHYRAKYNDFVKRSDKEQIEMEKQVKIIDSIFKIANK